MGRGHGGEQLVRVDLEQDLAAVRNLYRDQGHLRVRVSEPRIQLAASADSAEVFIEIDEGPRFSVGTVGFSEGLPFAPDRLRAWCGLAGGDLFSPSRLLQAESGLRAGLDGEGYPQAIVRGSEEVMWPVTAAIAAVVGALWGCSRFLATGPVNAVSLLVLPTLLAVAVPGSPEYLLAASLIANTIRWAVVAPPAGEPRKKAFDFCFEEIKSIVKALEKGAKSAIMVSVACAAAGIIVGMVTLTGMGLKFSSLVLELSYGIKVLAILLIGAASLVLGMGLGLWVALKLLDRYRVQAGGVEAE